jgi:tRNA(Ile)-lysidine synthase
MVPRTIPFCIFAVLRLYHVRVTQLAHRLFDHIRRQELLRPGERVGVAVSGGIDSVALLRLMVELRSELGIVLSVVHFNHKLRGPESDGDEQLVADIAREHGLEFYCDSDDVAGHAREQGVSLETAARELRYGFIRHLIRDDGTQGLKPHSEGEADGTAKAVPFHEPSSLHSASHDSCSHAAGGLVYSPSKVLTGHTLDDQAETVLMRVIRGAGMRGLGGIHPRIPVQDEDGESCGEIVRPLLGIRRRELEAYLKEIGQGWREDATNADPKFTRNRIRKLLVPLLEKEFNPAVAENLAELAEIARGEEDYWDNEVAGWMGTGVHWAEPDWAQSARAAANFVQIGTSSQSEASEGELLTRIEAASWQVMNAFLDRLWFIGEPVAVQRRVTKAVGDEAGIPLEFKHIEEIVSFVTEEEVGGGKELSLPLGWKIRRAAGEIVFVTPDLRVDQERGDYEYDLPLHGRVPVPELGSTLELQRVPADETGYNPDQLLDPDSLPGPLKVRNWRAGDRFWPAHTKSPKKIKELLQERHVAQPERRLWPVLASGDDIVWMRGFAVPQRFQMRPGHEALVVVETRIESGIQ